MPTAKRLRSVRCPHKRKIGQEEMLPYAGQTGMCQCCRNYFGYPSLGLGEEWPPYCHSCRSPETEKREQRQDSVHAVTAVACLNPLRPLPANETPETPPQPSMPYVAVSHRDIEPNDTTEVPLSPDVGKSRRNPMAPARRVRKPTTTSQTVALTGHPDRAEELPKNGATDEPAHPLLGSGHITPPEYATDPYRNLLVRAQRTEQRRVFLGIPVTGLVRVEFMNAIRGQLIPCNWSMAERMQPLYQQPHLGPLGYDVKDARNILVQTAVENGFEWLLFIDSDVVLPFDCFSKMNTYMREGKYPLVSGLYMTKSAPSEPLMYRGRGNSYYGKWQLGDKVWVDGCGMGCMLIHGSILKAMWADAPVYVAGGTQQVRMVYDTPQFAWVDPETHVFRSFQGTEDLSFFDRMREGDYLRKAGWKQIAKKKYPILVDTALFCRHITPDGIQYPLEF